MTCPVCSKEVGKAAIVVAVASWGNMFYKLINSKTLTEEEQKRYNSSLQYNAVTKCALCKQKKDF